MSVLQTETKYVRVCFWGEVVQWSASMSQSLVKSNFFKTSSGDWMPFSPLRSDGISLSCCTFYLGKKLFAFPQKLWVLLGNQWAGASIVSSSNCETAAFQIYKGSVFSCSLEGSCFSQLGFGGVHFLSYYFKSLEHPLWWDYENVLSQGN